MHVVRENSAGHPQSRKDNMTSKKASGKSNWDLMGKGKGKGSVKADLDEGGVKSFKSKSGGTKGYEATKKKKA